MKFRTKLYVGFGAILLLFLILSSIAFYMLSVLNQKMNVVVHDNFDKVRLATTIRAELNDIGREVNGMIISGNKDSFDKSIAAIDVSRNMITEQWGELGDPEQPELKMMMAQIGASYNAYTKSLGQLIAYLQNGEKDKATDLYKNDLEDKRNQLFDGIGQFVAKHQSIMTQSLDQSNRVYHRWTIFLLAMVGVIMLSGGFIAMRVFRSVTGSLFQLVSIMDSMEIGETLRLPRIQVKVRDEIGKIAEAYNRMAAALERQSESEAAYRKTLEEHSVHKTKIAAISSMYQGVRDLNQLAEMIMSELTPLLGGTYGIFYGMLEYPRLTRLASYAGEAAKESISEFALGEGLVGQCAKNNKIIHLTDVSDSDIRITTGLVAAVPRCVMVVPVTFEGQAIAVLEFASLSVFTQTQISLVEEVARTLGIAMNNIMASMQIQSLLKDSQQFTEELQAQSEELQLQQEEMRTLNEKLEEQFKHAERRNKELESIRAELEEKNAQVLLSSQYKSEFLANVSHELRTPLNSLLILAQMLADNQENNLLPLQLEHIRTIHSSGRDLLSLINEILDLSKIESGKMDVVYENTTIEELADNAERHFFPVAHQKGIGFQVSIEDGLHNLPLYTDVQKVQQIIKNLLSNAIKFTESGRVSLSFQDATGEPPASFHEDPGQARVLAISVADTGIGISAEKQMIIFDAFQQADGTTSRKYGGTGLGLTISKELSALLGGIITVDSKEGEGSTFVFYLPMDTVESYKKSPEFDIAVPFHTPEAAATKEVMLHPKGIDQSKAGSTVLIVDDDMRNIYVLSTALQAQGYKVIFAENGIEALEMLKRTPETGVVLMDIMMPKMDGFEAIREIRKLLEFRTIPIIALTAKAMKHDREACIEAGANDYISKPIQLEQLFSLMAVWLHK